MCQAVIRRTVTQTNAGSRLTFRLGWDGGIKGGCRLKKAFVKPTLIVLYPFASFNLTNNIDGQHMLSNVPNGLVTNGVMTLAVTSEGGSVTDHGFDERLSPHVTPDSVASCVTPDTNGPTPLNAYENGHETQEHYNGSSSTATGAVAEEKPLAAEDAPPPKQELSEERTVTNKEDEHTQREETPKRESAEGVPVDKQTETGIPAEEKQATDSSREEVKQPPDSDEGECPHLWTRCL